MRDRERERDRDIGRGRSRLHAGSLMWDSIPGLQDHTLSQRQTLNHCHPGIRSFSFVIILESSFLTNGHRIRYIALFYLSVWLYSLFKKNFSSFGKISSDLFSVYFSGVIVAILGFCSLVHQFFSGQNDKMKKFTSKKENKRQY